VRLRPRTVGTGDSVPPLMDVDTIVEARAVAALVPETRFARTLIAMEAAA